MSGLVESEELVEAVARAICKANCPTRMTPEQVEIQVENGWDLWIREARAALAVAEPAIRADERERAATLIERRNPNEGGRLDALAIRAGQSETRG